MSSTDVAPPPNITTPTYRALRYGGMIAGLENALVDYYVEATDALGNVTKTDIQHVFVGSAASSGNMTVTLSTNPAQAGQPVTVSYDPVGGPLAGFDEFDRWASERNRAEDQSVSARYVPRTVIGYSQLDSYGSWAQDPSYGAIWYPRVTVQDWAPYRYGRWTYVRPWGRTWVDDAPWGFAPFHYGRWAYLHGRWGWVPGHFGPRPRVNLNALAKEGGLI